MKTIFWIIFIIDFLMLILCLRLWQENKRIRKEILENEGGVIEHKSDAGPKPDPRLINYIEKGYIPRWFAIILAIILLLFIISIFVKGLE